MSLWPRCAGRYGLERKGEKGSQGYFLPFKPMLGCLITIIETLLKFHYFEVHHSVVFILCMEFCNHVIPEHFYHAKRNPIS